MKIKSVLMCLVAITMVFTSCNRDKIKDPAANTLTIEGKTYSLISSYKIDQNGRGYADAVTLDRNADNAPLYSIIADVETSSQNGTYDLTVSNVANYYFNVHDEDYIISYSQDSHNGEIDARIDDVEYTSGIFKEGKLTVKKDDEVFSYTVSGTLVNGKPMSFNITVPASDWEYLLWK